MTDGDRLTMQITSDPMEIMCLAGGDIDLESGPRFEGELLAALFASDATTLTLDLANIRFMDSSGLRVVIDMHTKMRDRGGRLVLRHPSGTVTRLLDITNLTNSLEIEP